MKVLDLENSKELLKNNIELDILEPECPAPVDPLKAAVIGCGFVGSASAFALMQSGLFSELVLIDSDRARAEGEALDISHGVPLSRPVKIYAGDYSDIGGASVIILAAGANQKPGETRLDLVHKNVKIFKSIIPKINDCGFGGTLLVVANPVDVLTYAVLDTARLRQRLGELLGVDSRSVHAFIIGEHGDSEIAAWHSANVAGIPLNTFCEMRGDYGHEEEMLRIAEDVKNMAYEIISKKKATYYGIAMAVKRICEAIVRDEKSILPVSSIMRGEYGIEGAALGIPAIVGKDGIEGKVPISVSESAKLLKSADTVKSVIKKAEI